MPNFWAIKISRKQRESQNEFGFTELTRPGVRRNCHKSSDCLEYPKNPFLNQATPKNTCQNFPPPKIFWSSLSLENRSTPSGYHINTYFNILRLVTFLSKTAVQIVEWFYSYVQPDNVMFHSGSVLSVFLHERYHSDSYPVTNQLYWLLIQRFAVSTELIR